MRRLVLALQGLGNTVFALRALEPLLGDGCDSETCLAVCDNGSQSLAEALVGTERTFVWKTGCSAPSNILTLASSLRRYRFGRVCSAYPSGRRENLLVRLLRFDDAAAVFDADMRASRTLLWWLQPRRLDRRLPLHDISVNAALFGVDAPAAPASPLLRDRLLDQGTVRRWRADGRSLVALHPGALGAGKRWASESYVTLGRALVERRGCRIAVVGGLAERALMDRVAQAIGPAAACQDDPRPSGLCSILAAADLFVGNDSAPLHLAAAVGTSCLAIWGYTDFRRTSPYGPGHVVLRRGLACNPCYRYTVGYRDECPYELECIRSIQPDEVIALADAMLSGRCGRDAVDALPPVVHTQADVEDLDGGAVLVSLPATILTVPLGTKLGSGRP